MSLAEIAHRFKERFLTEQERFLTRHSRDLKSHFPMEVENAETGFRREEGIRFCFSLHEQKKIQEIWQSSFSAGRKATLQTSEALLSHKVSLFGKLFELGDKINWSRDVLTGREWPKVFWADINIRDGQTIGGVKWVWELNRHHHLVTLGKAYFLSGEGRYAEEVCTQLVDWIQTNPPRIGVNWSSPLELAVRLINWLWALAFIRRSPALTSNRLGVIQASIAQQAYHISRHLSAYSSANNHLIGEAAGLAIVGMTFPWLRHASQWRDMGLKILTREIERQIHPDGVPAEQALHYLIFILDFNLLVWRLAELNELTVPQIWYDRLGAACNFIRHIIDEQGNVPFIGDSDDAWVIRFDDHAEANNYRSILATAAVILERPEFKAIAGGWDEKSHWLMGESGLAIYDSLSRKVPAVTSHVFKDGGYCVMRAPGRGVVFDCGPLGYLSTGAHGHADALSLTVSLNGQPFLVDPGTYAYQEGGKWRDHFRSTVAHNTVVIDGCNQSEMIGTFLWGRKANAQLLRWESTPSYDFAVAEHDGDTRLGVTHRRTVLFYRPDWLLIVDELQGEGVHAFEQLWHLATNCHADIGSEYTELTIRNQHLIMIPLDMFGAKAKVLRGEKSPIQGWISSRYGHIKRAAVISFSGKSSLPIRLVIAFCLTSSSIDTHLSGHKTELLDLLARLEKEVNS